MSRLGTLLAGLVAVACGAPPPAPPAAAPSTPPLARECVEAPRSGHPPVAPVSEPLETYQRRVIAQPTDRAALFDLVRAYERDESWDPAARTATRLLQLEPANARYQYHAGLNFLRQVESGNRELAASALDHLAKCVKQDPRFAECYFLLGELAIWVDDEQLAEQRYRQAIEIDPTRADPYLRLAELYLAYRLDDAAVAVLGEALRFVPVQGDQAAGRFPVFLELAQLELRNGHADRALALLQRAEPLADAGPPIFTYALATAHLQIDPTPEGEQRRKLTAWMRRFHEQCGAEPPKKYYPQCSDAHIWVLRFGESP